MITDGKALEVDINTPYRVCMRRIYNALMTYEHGEVDIPDTDGYYLIQYLKNKYFVPPYVTVTTNLVTSEHIYHWLVGESRNGSFPITKNTIPLFIDIESKKFKKALNLFKLKYPRATEPLFSQEFPVGVLMAKPIQIAIATT